MVRQLLARGADPHVRDAAGATALYWAARMGHPAVVTQLLEFDPSLLDAPVITAARGLVDLPRWLQPGRSGMHHAQGLSLIELLILTRRSGIVLSLLRRHRSRINVAGLGGTTPLMLCAATAQSELVIWLLANGADARLHDHAADHALLHALDLHATECARVIIEHDPALAHLPGQGGRTPAMLINERLEAAAPPALKTGPRLLQNLLSKRSGRP
jgi:ankyrin repeat protein